MHLKAGDAASGTIDLPGAIDDYLIEARAGEGAYFRAAADCNPASRVRWRLESADTGSTLGDSAICSDLGKTVFDKTGKYRLKIYSYNGATGDYRVLWATR